MLNLLPWLLHGSKRKIYQLKQTDDAWIVVQDLDITLLYVLCTCACGNPSELHHRPSLSSLNYTLTLTTTRPHNAPRCLLVIVALRLLFNYLFSSAANRIANRRGTTPVHRDGKKLLEETWVLCGNIVMLSLAAFIMLTPRNGGCWFGDIKPCLVGWPNHPTDPLVTIYYALELAWYCHLLLKPLFKYGQVDGRDMMIHHCASMALLIASCGLNLTRMGIIVLTLFGISNPALHAAKIANQLHLKFRVPAFGVFAVAFLVTRVMLVPPFVLLPAAIHSRDWVGYAVRDFHTAYIALNILLVILYCMQLVWMWAIGRVLKHANDPEKASRVSAAVDPAKRY